MNNYIFILLFINQCKMNNSNIIEYILFNDNLFIILFLLCILTIYLQIKNREYFIPIHRKDMKHNFCINHYAAIVKYSVEPNQINNSSNSNNTDNNNTISLSSNSWISKINSLEDLAQRSSL